MEGEARKRGGPVRHIAAWVNGSIRRKLTALVLMVCLLLIMLFWVFAVQLLQPVYLASIRADLADKLDVVCAVLDQADAEGVALGAYFITPDGLVASLSKECVDRLNAEIDKGTLSAENICLDIAGTDLTHLLVHDTLPGSCALHGGGKALNDAFGENSPAARKLRRQVHEEGEVSVDTETQTILGRTAAGGQVSVIVSANLERIPEAVRVLRGLMLGVSILLVGVSIACAFVFSRWFSRPLTRLSAAAREVARGNYDVSVQTEGEDEIARLSQDFNTMAGEVKRTSQLQRDLFANVSHDLRTPLTLIKGFAETLREFSWKDEAKRNEQLGIIIDESDRLSQLVGSVMELSRVSSGVQKPVPIRFDLAQLCDEVAERYAAICAQKHYTCGFEAPASAPLMVEADPGLLERALHNLLGNALAHIGPDGYIGLAVFQTGGKARVEVRDHGPGIAPEDLPHLFDRYYRSRSDAGKPGAGLGLSITKAIFEASGFAYGVDSRLGQGASFWFEVPLAGPKHQA